MLKAMGCLMILTGSTMSGFMYGDNLKKRVFQLNELERAVYQLQNEMTYTYALLPDAFKNVAGKSKEPIKEVFNNASEFLESNEYEDVHGAMKKAIEITENKIYLNSEDINILIDLARTLGESDMEGQNSVFNLTFNNISKQIKIAENVMNKNMKMYRYLGFSLGAMLVIILV